MLGAHRGRRRGRRARARAGRLRRAALPPRRPERRRSSSPRSSWGRAEDGTRWVTTIGADGVRPSPTCRARRAAGAGPVVHRRSHPAASGRSGASSSPARPRPCAMPRPATSTRSCWPGRSWSRPTCRSTWPSSSRGCAPRYPGCFLFYVDGFVGASPELLVPRAATSCAPSRWPAPRRAAATRRPTRRLAAALLASATDRHEHQVTIDMVHDTLLRVVLVPRLRGRAVGGRAWPTCSTWPPWSRAGCRSRRRRCSSSWRALHPTPAVCGWPRDAALALIAEHEGFDRGRYAGAVGWVDAAGNGTWAVGIRCAEIDGATARVFAGNGIVADSDPDTELAETQAKLQAMLSALVRPEPDVSADRSPAADFRRTSGELGDGVGDGGVEAAWTATLARGRCGRRGRGRRPSRARPATAGLDVVDLRWAVDAVGRRRGRRGRRRGRAEELLEALGGRPSSACGRNEKMPPPSLSTTTIVRSMPRVARRRAGRCVSCRKASRRPAATVGPRVVAEGDARPRSTRRRRCRWRPGWRGPQPVVAGAAYHSRSRIGIDDDTTSAPPGGRLRRAPGPRRARSAPVLVEHAVDRAGAASPARCHRVDPRAAVDRLDARRCRRPTARRPPPAVHGQHDRRRCRRVDPARPGRARSARAPLPASHSLATRERRRLARGARSARARASGSVRSSASKPRHRHRRAPHRGRAATPAPASRAAVAICATQLALAGPGPGHDQAAVAGQVAGEVDDGVQRRRRPTAATPRPVGRAGPAAARPACRPAARGTRG